MKVRGEDPDLEQGLSGQYDTVPAFFFTGPSENIKKFDRFGKKNEIFMRSEFSKNLLGHCLKLYLNPELFFGS